MAGREAASALVLAAFLRLTLHLFIVIVADGVEVGPEAADVELRPVSDEERGCVGGKRSEG